MCIRDRSQRADQAAVQSIRDIPKSVLHTWDASRAGTRDGRGAGRLRHAHSRAQRICPRESVGNADHVLPRRPGIRRGTAVIANTAFLAALSTFLLAAWLAGALTLLAPYKPALFRMHGAFIAG